MNLDGGRREGGAEGEREGGRGRIILMNDDHMMITDVWMAGRTSMTCLPVSGQTPEWSTHSPLPSIPLTPLLSGPRRLHPLVDEHGTDAGSQQSDT